MTRPRDLVRDEGGAVLVFSALLLIVLMAFAALTVDLGAAWAGRRSTQNAADAAAMAGGLEYLATGAASAADVVDVVRDYAARNLDLSEDSADWLSCSDPDGLAEGFTPMEDSDGNEIECISLKQGSTGSEELLLRVRIPDRSVSTMFAKVIGIDSMTVSAFAVAEVTFSELAAVLPLSVPDEHGTEECLGTPPSGQLKLGEAVACTGPLKGNFGLLDSPFFEDHEIEGQPENSCHKTPYPNFNTRTPFNLAAGLDHPIQVWAEDTPIPYYDLKNNATGADTCEADAVDAELPYVLGTQTGNRDLIQGLIGPGTYDGGPGRLRRGDTTKLTFDVSGPNDFGLDNVGLWEYLITPNGTGNDPDFNKCKPDHYDTTKDGVVGREATNDIVTCLDKATASKHPEFDDSIIDSPRFALVPVLAYKAGELKTFTGTEYRAVVELKPVYLHTAWFDCGSSAKNDPCWFKPDVKPPVGPTTTTTAPPEPPPVTEGWSILFNPGEGTTSPFIVNNKDAFERPKSIEIDGITGLILEWEWLSETAKNQIGQTAPLTVSLYR